MSMRITNALWVSVMAVVSTVWVAAQPVFSPPPPAPVPAILTVTNLVSPTALVAPAVTNPAGGKIQFASSSFDFGRVRAGEMVRHTYYFTNVGQEVLEVPTVQPTCGCTAAGDWTRKVEPGQTGQIPILFDTHSYTGPIIKGVTVQTSDKTQGVVILQLSGTIYKPIDVLPAYPILTIQADSPSASTIVQITNNMEPPLMVFAPEGNTNAFRFTLETNEPGRLFKLTITALPPITAGVTSSKVTLHTSLIDMPVLDIPFSASVVPAVTLSPSQVVLPQAPLATVVMPAVTIMCNSTNSLTLSEPAVNVEGVAVQINTIQANKIYVAQLTFPQGFQMPADKQVQFTAKTSLPQYPSIVVPVMQLVPPKPPSPPAGMMPVAPGPVPAVVPPATPVVTPVVPPAAR
jgi:hypothetical protein